MADPRLFAVEVIVQCDQCNRMTTGTLHVVREIRAPGADTRIHDETGFLINTEQASVLCDQCQIAAESGGWPKHTQEQPVEHPEDHQAGHQQAGHPRRGRDRHRVGAARHRLRLHPTMARERAASTGRVEV